MPRAKPDAPEQSRWRLDEAVRGETAIDASNRVEFEFAAGEISVDVGSVDEAILARALTPTGHAVPVDDNAKTVALPGPEPAESAAVEDAPASADETSEETA